MDDAEIDMPHCKHCQELGEVDVIDQELSRAYEPINAICVRCNTYPAHLLIGKTRWTR